jgi:hypothetical protein
MKKLLAHTLSFSILCLMFSIPVLTHAQSFQLILCDGTAQKPCDFNVLMKVIKNTINALIALATLMTTIALIWIGFVLVTAGVRGDVGAATAAKKTAGTILKGYLWILAAWLIVYTIFTTLLKDGYDDAFR